MNKFIFILSFFPLSLSATAPIHITADEIIFNHNSGKITAEGGVEAKQEETTLSAPHAEYDTKTKGFTSWGGIIVEKENGERFETDSIYTEDGFSKASLESLKLDLSDGASITAESVKKEGDKIVLKNPSYTACERTSCSPTWEIRASKVTKNDESLSYIHARLNLWGVPIFYTPYLSHPTPKAKRQTGFLFPKLGSTTDLGSYVKLPFYIAISPTQDLTLTPMTTSEEDEALGIMHRKNFSFGQTRTEGLYTQTDTPYGQQEDRWYISSQNFFNLTNVWRGSFDFNRTSDDTFLRKYDIKENQPYLETRSGIEGLWNKSYLTIKFHDFQDLRIDTDDDSLPQILPIINYKRTFSPLTDGSYFSTNINLASLKYENDGQNNRASAKIAWTKSLFFTNGWKWTLDLSGRGDFYQYDEVPLENGNFVTSNEERFTPQALLQWEWTFFRQGESTTQILTPTIQFIASPQKDLNEIQRIINTDSQGLRLDDTNLFSDNRFAGYDRIETGNRINYGLGWDLFGLTTGKVNAFVGQSFRFEEDESIASETSLKNEFSDFVGRLLFDFNKNFKSAYRAQVDKDTLSFNRQELDLFLDLDRIYFQTNYIFNREKDASVTDTTASEEIYAKTFIKISTHWGTYLYDRYNMTTEEQTEIGAGLIYQNDCFKLDIGAKREYMQDRDYKGDDSFFITFTFKTLGSAGMGESWEEIKNENRW
ncbi:MAG: LPS-assembly protein LptD [Alphaproteobacteria bacterium]